MAISKEKSWKSAQILQKNLADFVTFFLEIWRFKKTIPKTSLDRVAGDLFKKKNEENSPQKNSHHVVWPGCLFIYLLKFYFIF